jgi:hypothetical protein
MVDRTPLPQQRPTENPGDEHDAIVTGCPHLVKRAERFTISAVAAPVYQDFTGALTYAP